ncbi:MAG: hypothetical protein Q7J57_11810 [Gemmobacter sp.]|nr:hypothetical protein [Gemmobacter sp.]
MLDGLYHDRQHFGGGLYQMWPAAVLAASALPQQKQIRQEPRETGEQVQQGLRAAGASITVFADGTNTFLIETSLAAAALDAAAQSAGLKLAPPSNGKLAIKINATWCSTPPQQIADRLMRTLAGQN